MGYYDMTIEKSGYVCVRCFNHYTDDKDEDIKHSILIRADSVYNDTNCEAQKALRRARFEAMTPEQKENWISLPKGESKAYFGNGCRA